MRPDIRHVVQGEPHGDVPTELRSASLSRREVVPWLCPKCHGIVAETVVDYVTDDQFSVRTVLPFEAVHHADADDDDVPYYGPTQRALKGKDTSRRAASPSTKARSLEYRRREAWRRALAEPGAQADLATALTVPLTFDTLCLACPLRVRVTLPPR